MNAQRWRGSQEANKGAPIRGSPSSIFEPWHGARVASPHCPILRPGCFTLTRKTANTNLWKETEP